ncbi:Potassium channel tetramerization-type BTB domain [Venturia nashicola]|nr:Potassium channel tetramerization-type BTB domain [Venturia nashicola]
MPSKPDILLDESPRTPEGNRGLQDLHDGSNERTVSSSIFLRVEPSPVAFEDPFVSGNPSSSQLEKEGVAPVSARPKQVTIQIGDMPFTLRVSTMQKYCRVLSNQFCSDRWNTCALEARDGVYIMEGNADMFTYLYDYMVYGSFPLFYDYHKGFAYAKYARLLVEAEYWQVDGVTDWIKGKKFEGAVDINITCIDLEGTVNGTLPAGAFYEFHPRVHVDRIYICPRDIFVHRGDKRRCGIACMKAKGDDDDRYEKEETLKTMRIEKKVMIHDGLLKENRGHSQSC